jgi:hypothetical protein
VTAGRGRVASTVPSSLGFKTGKPAGADPRRFTRRRNEMSTVSIFLPLIVVILELKVKVIVIRKTIIRKQR